jgi:hypothetical protein
MSEAAGTYDERRIDLRIGRVGDVIVDGEDLQGLAVAGNERARVHSHIRKIGFTCVSRVTRQPRGSKNLLIKNVRAAAWDA